MDAHDATNNPFWHYSLKVYQRCDCASFLLAAQDRFGLNINLVLLAGWLAKDAKQLNASIIQDEQLNEWQNQVTAPIRRARVKSKILADTHFYEQIKKVELASEQAQQALLYQLALGLPKKHQSDSDCLHNSMTLYFKQLQQPLENSWIRDLQQHLLCG